MKDYEPGDLQAWKSALDAIRSSNGNAGNDNNYRQELDRLSDELAAEKEKYKRKRVTLNKQRAETAKKRREIEQMQLQLDEFQEANVQLGGIQCDFQQLESDLEEKTQVFGEQMDQLTTQRNNLLKTLEWNNLELEKSEQAAAKQEMDYQHQSDKYNSSLFDLKQQCYNEVRELQHQHEQQLTAEEVHWKEERLKELKQQAKSADEQLKQQAMSAERKLATVRFDLEAEYSTHYMNELEKSQKELAAKEQAFADSAAQLEPPARDECHNEDSAQLRETISGLEGELKIASQQLEANSAAALDVSTKQLHSKLARLVTTRFYISLKYCEEQTKKLYLKCELAEVFLISISQLSLPPASWT